MDPLVDAVNKKSTLVNKKNIDIIFAHIPELIMLSNALVQHLISDDETIGKLFCEFEPYFEIYIAYAVNFSKSRKHLTQASSNITYHQLVQVSPYINKLATSNRSLCRIQREKRMQIECFYQIT